MADEKTHKFKVESPKEAVTRLLREAYCIASIEYKRTPSFTWRKKEWSITRERIALAWQSLQPSHPSTSKRAK